MRVERLGDAAVILYELPMPSHLVAKALESLSDCREAAAGYDAVGLYFDPGRLEVQDIESFVLGLGQDGEAEPVREVRVPVCYELGDDIAECAGLLGISSEDLAAEHCSGPYDCFALGFTPGFPYLGYLSDRIAGLPRRAAPRVRVAKGSIGITGRQTGIYPAEGPGGWNLIGRTPLEIVNLKDRYFPLNAGDRVAFYMIDFDEYRRLEGERL